MEWNHSSARGDYWGVFASGLLTYGFLSSDVEWGRLTSETQAHSGTATETVYSAANIHGKQIGALWDSNKNNLVEFLSNI